MNSLDGYAHAVAERSGKVVRYTFRTKVGPLKNWSKASKPMEADMIVQIVRELNEEETGVWIEGLCMDLDSSARAKVREYCRSSGQREPRTLHDLNHFIRALKGRFIELKKTLKRRGVFTPETQLRLANQFALMIHQHRVKLSSVAELREALLQVIEHAFNRHTNCHKFFACPCGRGGTRPRSSYNADGVWLDARGGPPLEASLRKEVESMTTKHGTGLLHAANTNVVEAVNGLAVSMTPKSLCVAASAAAPARQAATVARFNDGLASAVGAVMRNVGRPLGTLAQRNLARLDATRRRHGIRKATPRAKLKRRRAQETRKARTQAEDPNGDGAEEYRSGMAF